MTIATLLVGVGHGLFSWSEPAGRWAAVRRNILCPARIISHHSASPFEITNNGHMDRFDAMRVFTRIVERRSFT